MSPEDVASTQADHLDGLERNPEGLTRNDLAAVDALVAPTRLGDLPLVVLSHGRPEDQILLPGVEAASQALQAELGALSSAGRVQVVPGAGHRIAGEAPDAVVDAITSLLR